MIDLLLIVLMFIVVVFILRLPRDL